MSEAAHDLIELAYGPVTPLLTKAVRAQLTAGPGKVFYGGDWSAIEARVNAWFAGETWRLEAFAAYDKGLGADLYKVSYAKNFHADVDAVTNSQRRIGKTTELACGYQGSVGAWLRFDPDPKAVTRIVREHMFGTDAWREAEAQYDRAVHHLGLAPDEWIAVKVVINGWRAASSNICASWWALQDAAIEAVSMPGFVVPCLGGKVRYLVEDGFLWCRLPSGKLLAYSSPRLVETRDEWLIDGEGNVFSAEELSPEQFGAKRAEPGVTLEAGRTRTQVQFRGKNQKTGAWGPQRLYGGMQCNNVVQGFARELLRFAMHNVERANYPIVLHVHDEIVSEVDARFGSVAEYEKLMAIMPPWAAGLPLSSKAWTDRRYVK